MRAKKLSASYNKGEHDHYRSSYSSRPSEESNDKDKYVLRSEYKASLTYNNKLNRNYKALLQMFVNEIANKILMRQALLSENTVPTFKNIIENTNQSSNQSASTTIKKPLIADLISKSAKQDKSFEELLSDTHTEPKEESSGRQASNSNSRMNSNPDSHELKLARIRTRSRSRSREYRNFMATIELSFF